MIKKQTALAVMAGGMVALAASSPSHAYVMGSSMVEITNFVINKNSTGNILDANTDLSSLTFTSSADHDVDLFGTTLSNSSSAPPIDFAPICVGGGCNPITPNNTFPKLAAPPASGDYAAADQNEAGAPIANVPGFPTPATVGNGSYVGIDTGFGAGSANSNNNLNSNWVFALNQADALDFQFDADAFLQAAVSSTEIFPGFATAAHFVSFSITDLGGGSGGGQIWSFDPDGNLDAGAGETADPFDLNNTISLNAPLPMDAEIIADSGAALMFSSTTPVLVANNLYQLSARLNTNADATRVQAVPEPGMLALVGIGLLGLGMARRRRNAA